MFDGNFVLRATLVASTLACSACTGPPPPPRVEPTPLVRVEPVRRGIIAEEIPVVGTVVPVDVSRVATGVPGPVVRYPWRVGAYIEAGVVLTELRSVTVQIQIEAAQALLRQSEQQYAELEAGYRAEEIAQSEARMKATEAERIYTKANADRINKLYDSPNLRPVTERERDEAVFQAESASQAHAEATADYEMKIRGNRPEAVAAAKAAVDAQQKEVARLEDELRKKTIRAPFSGFLVEKSAEVGEWVESGSPVGTLVRLDEVEVHVNVEESHIHQIKVGQTVDVLVDALGDKPIAGQVKFVVPKSDWSTGSRSFPVIVSMENSFEDGQPLLKEGMVARIRFRGPGREALLAHKDAVVRSSGTPTVFVVGDDGRVRAVVVAEGISQDQFVEIHGNVAAGDLLVTEGVERLRPFDEVAVLEPPSDISEQGIEQAAKSTNSAASAGG